MDGASTERTHRRQRAGASADVGTRGGGPHLASLRTTATRLAALTRAHRWAVVASVVLFFASSAIDPLVPAFFKWLIDNGFGANAAVPLWTVPVVIVGLFAARGLLAFAGAFVLGRATADIVLMLRKMLMRSVVHADSSLYAHLSPGVAAARVIADPQNAIDALAGALTTLLRDGTTLIALMSYLLYLNWQLTLASLVTVPLLALIVRRVQLRVLGVSGESWESRVRLIGIVDDLARAWRVVRTFNAAEYEERRFDREARALRDTTFKATVAGASMTPLTQIVASFGVALIVMFALVLAQRGGGTVGDFVAFTTTLLMTISPMRHLTDVTQPIVGGLVQARACFDLMDYAAEPDNGRLELPKPARGELQLQDLHVVHAGAARPALSGIDLHVPSGSTVALVGPSGSGKSTLVSTLLAFVQPLRGSVRMDGIDVHEIRKASLRAQFAVVSQDIVLFDTTIEDNVVYAQPHDRHRVEASLRAADLWDFVENSAEGLATRVGTNGARLSGGQRQRLAIARALYKEASVWVFDEATSALDSASERVVHDAIQRWRGSRTLLLIAHRLSTVRDADTIHVLAEGRIIESGRHDELLSRNGLYASMVRAQHLA